MRKIRGGVLDTMPRGRRSVVVAVVGCLTLGIPQKGNAASHEQEKTEKQIPKSQREIGASLSHANETYDLNKPCEKHQANRNSQLCAYWQSADEAENADHWAARMFWLGMGGSAIGLLTLAAAGAAAYFAWVASDQARRSNLLNMKENARASRRSLAGAKETAEALEHASANAAATTKLVEVSQKTAAAQLRAYLGVSSIKCVGETPTTSIICVSVKNYGITPARDIEISAAAWGIVDFKQKITSIPTFRKIVSARKTVNGRDSEEFQVFTEDISEFRKHVGPNSSHMLFICGNVTYADLDEVKRNMGFFYRMNGPYRADDTEFIPYITGNDAD